MCEEKKTCIVVTKSVFVPSLWIKHESQWRHKWSLKELQFFSLVHSFWLLPELAPAGHYKESRFKAFMHWLYFIDPMAMSIFFIQFVNGLQK